MLQLALSRGYQNVFLSLLKACYMSCLSHRCTFALLTFLANQLAWEVLGYYSTLAPSTIHFRLFLWVLKLKWSSTKILFCKNGGCYRRWKVSHNQMMSFLNPLLWVPNILVENIPLYCMSVDISGKGSVALLSL